METSVKTAKVLVPPQPDVASLNNENTEGEAARPAARGSSSDLCDPMLEFSRRLEDILSTHGSAASLLDKQSVVEAEMEKMKEEAKDDVTVTTETDVSLVMQSLKNLKLEDVMRKYAELAALRCCDEKKLCVLQQKLSVLLEDRQQLQAERRSSVAARSKLESLCWELQSHYSTLREETLQRCREDEEKRKEITSHFQKTLTEIQAQIEQHSTRNDKLCSENANLTDKLESLMNQCELREESLEKINKHRDLQHKLTEAKLQQANALLAEAEEKHKREKEYLLIQAAEWKLQAQTLREQGTVMQAQLTLYAQKFDEFQATLAKSNEIYVRFKKEMDNMSAKMKKVEKESNLWKTRFENCNKALTDMIEERTEKGREYELFVLKIHKLEKLCHVLQDERKILYAKIKEVRRTNSIVPLNVFGSSDFCDVPGSEDADKSAPLKPVEVQELEKEDPVLTEDMARLREEQARLQEFADSLLTTPVDDDDEDNNGDADLEEDAVASAFVHFKAGPQVKKEPVSVPEQVVGVKSEVAETDLPQPDKVEEVQKPEAPKTEEKTSEMIPADPQPEAVKVQTQAEVKEVQQVKAEGGIQQLPSEQELTPKAEKVEIDPPSEILKEPSEVKPVVPAEDEKFQQQQQQPAEPVQASEEAPETSAPPSENTPKTAEPSNADSLKKQAPKKKKKKGGKNSS
ncbi:beta-taxilin-like isoform X2 [Seriola lalandi dorsalis]|uniref:beta-taxilin-like isoform X2 n=1 Tax=Seriola lalandi dorsalis TaxID=1841481 RepID=UPI000C6F8A73|nr:beta-taxilin-like isoform X2 [Seriola lalandi dorsalis]